MVKVFLIGDSISLDYGQYLQEFTDPDIHIYGKPDVEEAYVDLDIPLGGNGGDSSMVLEYLQQEQDENVMNCDLFFFNCGLHDMKRSKQTDQLQVPLEEYRKNLRAIVDFMQSHKIRTVFINSTPSDETRYGRMKTFYRKKADVPQYNQAAEEIMKEKNVPVIDLYGFTKALKLEGDDLFRDHTHFCTPVIQLHAAYIAGQINGFVKAME